MPIQKDFLYLQHMLERQALVLKEDDDCLPELRANHEVIMGQVRQLRAKVAAVPSGGRQRVSEWRGTRPPGVASIT